MINEWCEENKPQVVCIIESKLKQDILDSEININNYDIIRSDRKLRDCGGVAIYLSCDLPYNTLLQFSNSVCESLVIKIPSKNTVICAFYRPPDCYPNEFKEAIIQVSDILKVHEDCDIILTGDFNFPEIDWSIPLQRKFNQNNNQINTLLNLSDELFLQQLVTKPTRNNNILDLVFTNIIDSPLDCTTSFFKPFSDHNLVKLILSKDQSCSNDSAKEENPNQDPSKLRSYNLHKAEYDKMKSELTKVDWKKELSGNTASEKLNQFLNILLKIISQHAPLKKDRNKNFKSKFYKERRALWRRRRRLLNKRYITPTCQQKLDEIDLLIKKSHHHEKLHNENSAVEMIQLNSKYFFTYANKTRKGRDKIGPMTDKESGNTITEAEEMANLLQTQYCSVFSKPDSEQHIDNINDFFDENIEKEVILNDIEFSEENVAQAIKELKPNSAPGPDGIPPILLQKCSKELSLPLQMIFKHSLETGEVPSLMKDATIMPTHK